MTKQILVSYVLFYTSMIMAQNKDLYSIDKIENDVHKRNIGKVTFMNGNIPLEVYKETDFLDSYDLKL
jgi:hypothetical protein